MCSSEEDILSWLGSVTLTQDAQRTRYGKRPQPDGHGQNYHQDTKQSKRRRLLSPPHSPSDVGSGKQTAMSASPSKRRLANDPEQLVQEFDRTPRARSGQSFAALDDTDGQSLSIGPSTPSCASSKTSKVSRNSSPTKQFRNAELQQTGFRTVSFQGGIYPPSLEALLQDLKRIDSGDGIIPQTLRPEFTDEAGIPWFAFNDEKCSIPYRYPALKDIRRILDRANKCRNNHHGESSWNLEVHSRLLDWVLRDQPGVKGPLDYRYCLSAGLIPQYKPKDAPAKMVDFCLAIEVDQEEEDIINQLCRDRPGLSINHTDWGDLSKYPIAISIETKCHGDPYDTALLQVATWHSSQWRSLRWGGMALPTIEFLAGVVIIGHHWHFVATVLGQDGRATTFESLPMGSTHSLFAIYKLFASLQRLKKWAEEAYWPAFKKDMLGLDA